MIRILAPHLTSVRTVAIAVITTVSGFLQAQSLFIEVTNPPMDYALCGPTQPICVTIAHGGPDAILVNGFEGDYAPANWLFDADESGAVLDAMDAPDSIAITSGDTTGIGTATYCTPVDLPGTISFDWLFTTLDNYYTLRYLRLFHQWRAHRELATGDMT
ncbi:MAG: hypothetical protein IPN60_06390 [Saprospiraceae bacterium]|nr:hypothetical protein [Candidatus Opimibacter skivensis]